MKNEKISYKKNKGGFKLALVGLSLILLPFALITIAIILNILGITEDGANIGLGILALFTIPAGMVLLLAGLFWVLAKNIKPSKNTNRKK